MNADQLTEKLTRLQARADELLEERTRAAQDLQDKRAALVQGDATARDVTNAQGLYSTLDAALDDLSGQIEALQAELQAEQVRERAAALVSDAAQAAAECERAAREHKRLREELSDHITEQLEKIESSLREAREARERFKGIVRAATGHNPYIYAPLPREGTPERQRLDDWLAHVEAEQSLAAVLSGWLAHSTFEETNLDRPEPRPAERWAGIIGRALTAYGKERAKGKA